MALHAFPEALAHRGFSGGDGHTLENSMSAFDAAVRLGYRWVETDVHATADGVLLAFHDETLDRTTDARGVIAQLPWSVVSEARINGVEPIPRLDDLFTRHPQLCVNIDVKAAGAIEPLIACIEQHGAHDDLRSGTVLADGTTAGLTKARITEWMHAYVGHPLLSLYEPLRATTEGLDDAAAAEARARLLRAYSSGWGDALGSSVLHRAVDDALLLGRMSRVLSWRRALTRASDAELRSWGRTGAALIREVDEILDGQRQA